MAKQTLFTEGNQECTIYINSDLKIYLATGEQLFNDNVFKYSGYYVFDLEDAKEFRDELNKLIKILEDERA